MISRDEKVAFDMYFASIASMQYHPGSGTRDHKQLSLDECMEVAAQMILIRRKVTEEG